MKVISMEWHYENSVFTPPKDFSPEVWYGFVYEITNRGTGRKYIGKKFFWSAKTLPITKKRKRRKKLKVESNWRDYFGSNKHLQEELQEMGEESFYREILVLCKSKGECAYMEAKIQFEKEVLLKEEYYNGIIHCRVGAQTVKNLKK